MTMPNSLPKATKNRLDDGSQPAEKPPDSDVATLLAELIRQDDQEPATLDPGRELRRRACPSGE